MDHLPLPRSANSHHPRVPYVCDEHYDGGDWLTYPVRAGWLHFAPSADSLSAWEHERKSPSDDRALEGFLQSWIFFGLLHKVLSPQGLYDVMDYISEDSRGVCVQTKALITRLEVWRDRVMKLSEGDRQEISSCLVQARNSLKALGDSLHPGIPPAINDSLAAICELLYDAVKLTLSWDPAYGGLSFEDSLSDSEHGMVSSGWCPAEIAVAWRDFDRVSARLYLQHLHKPYLDKDHKACDAATCVNMQIEPATYRPRHTTEDCCCESLGPELEQVVACLEGKTFPVLRIRGHSVDDISIEPVPYDGKTPYVALSHVWADGLGNIKDISLPRCQLVRLGALVNDLRGRSPRSKEKLGCRKFGLERLAEKLHRRVCTGAKQPESEDLYLWCDSLCCPVGGAAYSTEEQRTQKRIALAKMREVYANAAYVLVLDRSFEAYSFAAIGWLEAAMRIFTSRWWRRLWTFQEAVLAENLLFQFADTAVDLRDIHQAASDGQSDLCIRGVCFDISILCSSIRGFFYADGSVSGSGSDLSDLVTLICHRRCSVQADEPLCISTILNIDAKAVAEAPEERRMEALWRCMSTAHYGIPSMIIFNGQSRLQVPGFGWAPVSLQRAASNTSESWLYNRNDPAARATLTEHGLQVEFPAWRIRTARVPTGLEDLRNPNSQPQTSIRLHVRRSDGHWFKVIPKNILIDSVKASPKSLLYGPGRDYIVMRESKHFRTGHIVPDFQTCLVGSLSNGTVGIPAVRSEAVVLLYRATPNEAFVWQAAADLAVRLRGEHVLQRLREISLSGEIGSDKDVAVKSVKNRIHETAKEALEGPQFAQKLESLWVNHPAKAFSKEIMDALMGNYAEITEEFDADSEWCVD